MADRMTESDWQRVTLYAAPRAICDWVMWAPCGCPRGVTVARCALTEADAWKAFYDRKRDSDRAQRQGCRMELVTHARWSAEIMYLMREPCPHTNETAATVVTGQLPLATGKDT